MQNHTGERTPSNRGRSANRFRAARSARSTFCFRTQHLHIADARRYCVCREQSGRERNYTRALNSIAHSPQIKDAIRALRPLRTAATYTQNGKAINSGISPWRNSFLFLAIVSTTIPSERKSKALVEQVSEPPHLTKSETKVVFAIKQTHRMALVYGATIKTMLTAIGFLEKVVGVKLTHSSLMPTNA